MRSLLKIFFLTAAVVILLKACTPFLGVDNPLTGQTAPEFTLPALEGGAVSLSAYRDNKPLILFFWASWCPNCHSELEKLSRLSSRIEAEGVRLLTVNIGESPEKVRRYLIYNSIQLPTALDEDGSLAGTYHIVGVPTYFVITQAGIVNSAEHYLKLDSKEDLLVGITQTRNIVP